MVCKGRINRLLVVVAAWQSRGADRGHSLQVTEAICRVANAGEATREHLTTVALRLRAEPQGKRDISQLLLWTNQASALLLMVGRIVACTAAFMALYETLGVL